MIIIIKGVKPTRRGYLYVLYLVDVVATRSGIERWYEGGELALQHKLIVPHLPPLSSHLHIIILHIENLH